MSKQRTVNLECGKSTQALYVIGTVINVDIYKPSPPGCRTFEVTSSPGVNCSISNQQNLTIAAQYATRWALSEGILLGVMVDQVSYAPNDRKVTVIFYGDDVGEPIDKMILELTAVVVSLDVDADRDGIVEKNNPNKGSWKWGPKGHGAILLVNCDKEEAAIRGNDNSDDKVSIFEDLGDMSHMILRTEGPNNLPAGYKLNLSISPLDEEKVQIFQHDITKMTSVLGRKKMSAVMDFTKGDNEIHFFAEGLMFPNDKITNLVTINLSLLQSMIYREIPIFTEQVVFRLAPWIMTPNTLGPAEVFVCSVKRNVKFLKEFKSFMEKTQCKLTVCPESMNLSDVWMQDEIEFGYTEAPHKYLNVVLDSPRDAGLQDFPYKYLLGPDFGHTKVTGEKGNSLNSFGNLEVSPPVTVNGKEYPLGRIIIGSSLPNSSDGRKMSKTIQDFLIAQEVQSPIVLYSDWLVVGHVDEFMTFVPAPDRKGFRLLLASPDSCYRLFKKLKEGGHGEARMFENQVVKPVKISEILNDQTLREENAYVQQCINWNRDMLKMELGLDEGDIIDIPALFHRDAEFQRALAYFPDMVNMLVIGKFLGIPKPFGPLINGKCPLESAVRSALEPLGLDCTFIDDFTSYHMRYGEVHCGSNVCRKPFTFKWWNMEI
ncbi:protein-arginine deiminase type-2 [Pristis pectinata]|uniref:protein-arginine deiminase type-2 n=1 Tax=Pristis pectinata TaxID=685728 RepID=UPI00223D8E85|nr:protein-arginine deiminase type-2 [Pristis pectinata]XP_051894919.1 protein-arginine deiminase type-2 [Pristis pectinata]XP_051894920.1 protein-arginine deiminase type-2 [Pristis pectinata]XP_051894921.1 protein-arginine deiminase type-2 [Pristis pectinata]XP_051894922.1 protein-arginine deiminase type-2 [Pristis pectinata]